MELGIWAFDRHLPLARSDLCKPRASSWLGGVPFWGVRTGDSLAEVVPDDGVDRDDFRLGKTGLRFEFAPVATNTVFFRP